MNIKLKTLLLASTIAIASCAHQPSSAPLNSPEVVQNNEQAMLQKIIDEEWEYRFVHNAESAHYVDFEYAGPYLGSVTPESYQKRLAKYEDLFQRLLQIDVTRLSNTEKVSFELLQRKLELNIGDIRFQSYQIPFLSESGFHTDIDFELGSIELKSEKEIARYLSTLEDLPRFYQEHIDNMRAGIARGFTMPKLIMPSVIAPLKRHLVDNAEDSPLWAPVLELQQRGKGKEHLKQIDTFRSVIQEKVLPAYKELYRFFNDEYLPNAATSVAASDRDNGAAYYQHEIKKYTTLDLTADDIHQTGLNEVKRIRAEMEAIIKEVNFAGTFQEFITFLRTDKQFYVTSAEQLLKEASYIAKKADGVLPKYFNKLPRQPYTVKPVPAAIAPNYTTGRYSGAGLNSGRAGEYWVNTYALDKRPLYVLEALTLHEAVPGHHLQGALTKEIEGLPKFRTYDYISAFGEGWALYCEYLGVEAGFYQDPYSRFGRLTYEMWRAIRLVVDTGMHAKGWTRQQSMDYMANNTALSMHNVRTEIDRYISWPGQALSYKLGELKIKELRKFAESELGEEFDIKAFHDELLSYGSVSLQTLENIIHAWVERQKKLSALETK